MPTVFNYIAFAAMGFALPTGWGWQFWLGIAAAITISVTSEIRGRQRALAPVKPYKKNW